MNVGPPVLSLCLFQDKEDTLSSFFIWVELGWAGLHACHEHTGKLLTVQWEQVRQQKFAEKPILPVVGKVPNHVYK